MMLLFLWFKVRLVGWNTLLDTHRERGLYWETLCLTDIVCLKHSSQTFLNKIKEPTFVPYVLTIWPSYKINDAQHGLCGTEWVEVTILGDDRCSGGWGEKRVGVRGRGQISWCWVTRTRVQARQEHKPGMSHALLNITCALCVDYLAELHLHCLLISEGKVDLHGSVKQNWHHCLLD